MSRPTRPISIGSTVDIGHGRGRLAPNPAASIARIDSQLRQLGLADHADINDAWRSPEKADENAAAWQDYLNGGPWAPYALDRWGSIHCRGYATDSDDWYNAARAAIWRRGGWRQTALYPVGDKRREVWHGEYDEALDEYLGQPAHAAARPIDPALLIEEEIVNEAVILQHQEPGDPRNGVWLVAPGHFRPLSAEAWGYFDAKRTGDGSKLFDDSRRVSTDGNPRAFDIFWETFAPAGQKHPAG